MTSTAVPQVGSLLLLSAADRLLSACWLRMQRAAVVCTTLTGVLTRDMRDVRFDVAVIDEAAQVGMSGQS